MQTIGNTDRAGPVAFTAAIKIPRLVAVLFSSAGLVMMLVFWVGAAGQILRGHNDFLAFYAAARLCGSPDLYNAQRSEAVQLSETNVTGQALRVVRPPFHAVFLFPLGLVPFHTAYLLWVLLNTCALAGFISMWDGTNRRVLLTACCCSIPIAASYANGQDIPLALFFIGLFLRLFCARRHFLAGVVLSLCAVKFHLFALMPLLLVAQGLWAGFLGAALGVAGLAGLSFLVSGSSWPIEYWAALRDSAANPKLSTMPNLHGMTSGISHGDVVLLVLSTVLLFGCWLVARRLDFHTAFAAALVGSLLVSYHSYVADAALLIPALLLLAQLGTALRYLALGLLSPVPWFLLLRGGLAANATRAALAIALAICVWQAFCKRSPSAPNSGVGNRCGSGSALPSNEGLGAS